MFADTKKVARAIAAVYELISEVGWTEEDDRLSGFAFHLWEESTAQPLEMALALVAEKMSIGDAVDLVDLPIHEVGYLRRQAELGASQPGPRPDSDSPESTIF